MGGRVLAAARGGTRVAVAGTGDGVTGGSVAVGATVAVGGTIVAVGGIAAAGMAVGVSGTCVAASEAVSQWEVLLSR